VFEGVMTRPKFRLGIDVGGTNTDAVLMCGKEVVAAAKSFTTEDVRSGAVNAVARLLEAAGEARADIEAVMIGTTQFVNAFVQRRELDRVAVFRVSLPKADGVPPLTGWPDDLVEAINPQIHMVGGGSYYTGKEYAPLDEDALRAAAAQAQAEGIVAVAISANFAPMRPDIEERAAAIVRSAMPGARITLSSQVGGLGLIERENATVINASLGALSVKVIRSLVAAFAELGIAAPIYISQNDGTLISTEAAERFPILTCSAGPTNSIRGAAFLTGLDEAIVADIGGTTTDIGFLLRGFPRETTAANYIGGVRTNFRMPDVLSIGLGGGSIVRQAGAIVTAGPQSVGYRLAQEGMVFGGQILTASDIAVRAGQADFGDPGLVAHLPEPLVQSALDAIHAMIEVAVDQVKTSPKPMPLVLVGGGSVLVSRTLKGASEVLRPQHAEVANAVGAAIALVSGRVDKLYDVGVLGRDEALAQARAEATRVAIDAGAHAERVDVLDIVELPMTHMRSGCVQIRVRVAGPLAAIA
jgi:N-methylhydantoinase A/oxoprolinase/acetone carboxylase beta subunit